MEMNKCFLSVFIALFFINLGYTSGHAQDMDHDQHGDQGVMAIQHEQGAPIYQNLNGPQLGTDLLVRFRYQFMWSK
jgi:hypothetical protein